MKKLTSSLLITFVSLFANDYDFKEYSQKKLFKEELSAQKTFDLKAQGITLIDVRSKNEYNYSHVPSSFWIPIYFDSYGNRTFNYKFVDQVLQVLFNKRDSKVILISKRNDRSRYAANILVKNGFSNVYILKDGLLGKKGWINSGYQYWRKFQ